MSLIELYFIGRKFNQNRFLFLLIQKEGLFKRETIPYVFGGSTPYYEFNQGGTKKGHIKINDDTDKIRWTFFNV